MSELLLKPAAGGAEIALRCHGGPVHKIMGRVTADGVFLWCRCCKAEHRLTWGQVRTILAVVHGRPSPATEPLDPASVALLSTLR